MGKKVISFDLTEAGIDQAIREVNTFKGNFIRVCNEIIQKLVTEGIGQAKMRVLGYGAFDTGQLAGSIGGFFNAATRTGIVYADSEYAAFVEYGTGVVGEDEPHPEKDAAGWRYDRNHHGTAGWVYKSDRDGNYHWTMGQPSKHFMYDTAKHLKDRAPGYTADLLRGL